MYFYLLYFLKLENMKKPKKSKAKRKVDIKRANKRTKRFKDSRKKSLDRSRRIHDKRRREQREYEDMMAKFIQARLSGEM